MEWIRQLLETASLLGVFRHLAEASTTDVVFVFLCSKPVFLVGCIGAALRAKHDEDGLPSPRAVLDADELPPGVRE